MKKKLRVIVIDKQEYFWKVVGPDFDVRSKLYIYKNKKIIITKGGGYVCDGSPEIFTPSYVRSQILKFENE